MIELVEGYRFIDSTLRNDATFTGYLATTPSPSSAAAIYRAMQTLYQPGVFPDALFCTYQYMGGHDDLGGGGVRIGVNGLFLVTVTGPGDQEGNIQTAASRMDDLLQGASGTTTNGTIYYLLRQQDFEQNSVVAGRLVTRLGGQYRTFLQKTGS